MKGRLSVTNSSSENNSSSHSTQHSQTCTLTYPHIPHNAHRPAPSHILTSHTTLTDLHPHTSSHILHNAHRPAPSHILTYPTPPHTPHISHTPSHTGFALAALLHSDGTGDATTTICHEHTPPGQLPVMTRTADIIIVGTGDVCVCLSRMCEVVSVCLAQVTCVSVCLGRVRWCLSVWQ